MSRYPYTSATTHSMRGQTACIYLCSYQERHVSILRAAVEAHHQELAAQGHTEIRTVLRSEGRETVIAHEPACEHAQ